MPTDKGLDTRRWLDAVEVRRSRREYDGHPIAAADLSALEALARTFRPWDDARCVVAPDAPSTLFSGIVGAYGRVNRAPSALLFIVTSGSPSSEEHVGYMGEAIVLEATARGLATCWVGGFFSGHVAERLVALQPGERVIAVSPVGYAEDVPRARERVIFGAGRPKHRRSLSELAPGFEAWPAWAQAGLRAVQLAPSAMNRQPCRLRFEDGEVVLAPSGTATPPASLRLDSGIAMLHFELAARDAGMAGSWESAPDPDVARFRPVLQDA
jgi:nitroreductase